MSRSEHDAHRDMQPRSYGQGYLDGQRAARNRMQEKRDREALSAALTWIAWIFVGFALGALVAVARGYA